MLGRKNISNSRRALALLELLVAVAILGVSIGGLVMLSVVGLRTSARAQRIEKATILCQNELEYWRVIGSTAKLRDGRHPFANPTAALPENRGGQTWLEAKHRKDSLVELKAVAMLGVDPLHPAKVELVTLLPAGGAR